VSSGVRARVPVAAAALVGIAAIVGLAAGVAAQGVLVDRVVARVNGTALLLSDVRTATAVGVVSGPDDEATERTIERVLLLAEVARFPPPEPSDGAVDAEEARLMAAAGPAVGSLLESMGLPASTVRVMARDSLRIQAYLDQRFGLTIPLTDDQVFEYYRTHQDAFRRNGVLAPFEEAEVDARRLAALERRAATVAQWVRDLRQRAEVDLPRASQ
jgi:hypothetical protein